MMNLLAIWLTKNWERIRLMVICIKINLQHFWIKSRQCFSKLAIDELINSCTLARVNHEASRNDQSVT